MARVGEGSVNTKTFASQMINGTLISLFSLVFAKGLNLFRTILVARLLSALDFGLFSLLFSFFYFVLNLAIFGFPATSAKYIASLRSRHSDITKFVVNLYFLVGCFALMVGAGVYLLAHFIASRVYQEPLLGQPIRWMGGAVFFQSLFAINMSLLQGFSLYYQRSALEIIDSLLGLGLMVLLVNRFSVIGVAMAFFVEGVISFIISFLVLWKVIGFGGFRKKMASLNAETIKEILKFSFPLFLTVISVYGFYWVGDILLKKYSSHLEQVGWMYIARSLGQVVLFIPVAMSVPLLPIMSSESEGKREEFQNYLRISWFLSFVVGMVIGVIARTLIPALFGTHYLAAAYAVFLYSIASIPMAMTTSIFSAILTGKGYIWSLTVFNLLWGFIFTGLSRLFIPCWEIEGAMYAYILSFTLLAGMMGFFMKKRGISSGITGGLILYFLGVIMLTALFLLRLEGTAYFFSIVIWVPVMITLGVFLLGKENRKAMIKRILWLFRFNITERKP